MAKTNKKLPSAPLPDDYRQLIQTFLDDPVLAASHLLQRNFAPLQMTWYQRYTLRGMWTHQFSYLVWSRGCGKTTMMAIYLLLRAWLHPNERCVVVSKGYRQALHVMREIERFWQDSPELQASTLRAPTFGVTESVLNFHNGSYIKAIPLGDGQGVRGERAQTLVVDEYAQMPKQILDTVVIPFLNVRADPMAGKQSGRENHMVIATSAYYQFNHAYETYLQYKELTDPNSPKFDPNYFLSEFDYHDTPPGFMDENAIAKAKRELTHATFLMEYENQWLADTEGFFPRSLVEDSRREWLFPLLRGDPKKEYVMGIDPARSRDAFAVVIIELAEHQMGEHKLVYANAWEQRPFQEMYERVNDLLLRFNIVRVHMDAGGGGTTMRDLLSNPYVHAVGDRLVRELPLLDMDDDTVKFQEGRHVLRMVKFAPEIINKMNMDLKAAFERKSLLIPGRIAKDNWKDPDAMEEAQILSKMDVLMDQIANIVATPTKTGWFHFDTPRQRDKKDLYSALLLAFNAALDVRQDAGEKPKQLAHGFWMNSGWIRQGAPTTPTVQVSRGLQGGWQVRQQRR